ncbi:MAG: serine/threonine-protein kinase [Gemmatimonadaceae bacterium]
MSDDLQATLAAHLAGRFTVTREIARGGMSLIYQATELRHSREVAIKVLRPEIAVAVTVERFLQEIQIESRLQHPHILPILDSGRVGDLPYCVLPYVAGPTLRDRLRAEGQLEVDEALRITVEIAGALEHAHRAGIVHRDVKPENILLADGVAILADFGIARAVTRAATERFTSEGLVIGTAAYMSPEQTDADAVIDGRSDLYSLGIVLFEMLAGDPPFLGRTAQAIIARHRVEPAPSLRTLRPTVPAPLAEAVARVLAKSPADRYPDAPRFVAALTRPVTPLAFLKSRRAMAAAGIAVAALAVAVLATATPLDGNAIAVFPVRDPATASATAAVPDDIAYAIELALDHARPITWRHGWDWLDSATRADPARLDAAMARRLARKNGVRYFIDGTIQRSGADEAVVLRLYDAGADTVVAIERAAAAAPADLTALGLEATRKLLLRWLAPGRVRDLAPLLNVAPAALALQAQGEREYRAARFTRALELFERAHAEDSTFAYAAIRAAQAASWLNRLDRARQLAQRALDHQAALPAQYRPFAAGLSAYLSGSADSAVTLLRAALALAPDWDEAHMALGEVHYHLLPATLAPQVVALAYFDTAAARDTTFTPPLMHLAEAAARRGDLAALDRYYARLRLAGADASWMRTLGIFRDCLRDPSRAPWGPFVAQDAAAALGTAKVLALAPEHTECATDGFGTLLVNAPDAGVRWGAFLGLHGQLVALGDHAAALQMLDSARTAGISAVLYLHVVNALAGAPYHAQADGVVEYSRERFGAGYAGAGAVTQWLLAAWHTHRRDRAPVERIAARLAASADSAPEVPRLALLRDAVAARVPLVQGDTAEAIRRLEALRPTARRDQLTYDFFEPLAVERMLLAELLMARGEYQRALDVAAVFDHPEPSLFVNFLPRSLAVRASAADSLQRRAQAAAYRLQLRQLTRARVTGPRR